MEPQMTIHRVLIAGLLLVFVGLVNADDNSATFDQYTVHYSVFNSDFLQPETARQYGLTRSRNLALVNLSIIDNQSGQGVTANILGNAYNLAGQNKDLAFKEIREEGAVYYIANFRFANEELLTFKLDITPSGQEKSYHLEFKQKVYTSQ
jgi:hypothetical protein